MSKDSDLWDDLLERMHDALCRGMNADDIVETVQRAACEFERCSETMIREHGGYVGQ